MKTAVVIPAYNEKGVIAGVINDVKKCQFNDIIVVDDGSSDDTAEIARQSGVTVLQHIINRGQGAALKTGMICALKSGAEIIVTFDADGQHQASDILKLVEPIQNREVDVTLGSRFINDSAINIPKLRKFVLHTAVLFTRVVSKMNITDTHNGLRAFSREALQKIRINQDKMAHASEILDEIRRNRISYKEVPVIIKYNDYSMGKGQSSLAFGGILIKYILGRIIK